VLSIKKLRVRKTDVDPFSLVDVQRVMATARPDYKDYFITRFLTGMRTGEVHGLKWKYVDFDLRIIRVRETFVLGEDEYTKTDGSQRDIQMSQPVFEALKRQFEVTAKASQYVFCNQEGLPLDNKNFTDRIWYPLLRNLGLERRRPYQMRHTAATLWLASGEAPEWIARQLGHTSTEMLFRVYSRYVPNLTRQDGSAMERLLASQLSQGPLIEQQNSSGVAVYVPAHEAQPPSVKQARPATKVVTAAQKAVRVSDTVISVPRTEIADVSANKDSPRVVIPAQPLAIGWSDMAQAFAQANPSGLP
jgi:integrase